MTIHHLRRRPLANFAVVALVAACGEAGADRNAAEPQSALSAACQAPNPELDAALERLDTALASFRDRESVPGMAVGIVCGDRLLWTRGFGVLAVDDSAPVTPRTPFRIASLTKPFTATAIMLLAESGRLSLDDPVERHVPWFEIARPPRTGTAPVTIRQLLTHTAGMPRDSRLTDFERLYQPDRAAAIEALPQQELEAPPGSTYAYSNLGYAVLGAVIEETSGESYAAFLEREIFAPLGMERTMAHPTRGARTAWGHGPRDGDGTRPKAGFWDLRFATPAGGMASSVVDLGRFVAMQLAPYAGDDPPLLSADAIRESHRVQHMIDPARGGSGLAWGVDVSDGGRAVYHGGELPDQTSFLRIDLQAGIGAIVLTNAEDVDAASLAGMMIDAVRGSLPAERYLSHPLPREADGRG